MSALTHRRFTQEEYAALEEKAEYKSQYVGGEIFAMAGAEPWHLKIVSNLSGMLYVRFRGRNCDFFAADLRVRVKAGEMWTYPDLVAFCHAPVYDTSSRPRSLLNPQAIFEVLSPSTEGFDRGEKFIRYQQIESLTDYVLIGSDRQRVEHFVRQREGGWLYREYHEGTDVLKLAGIEVELPLAEIYERVVFPGADEGV